MRRWIYICFGLLCFWYEGVCGDVVDVKEVVYWRTPLGVYRVSEFHSIEPTEVHTHVRLAQFNFKFPFQSEIVLVLPMLPIFTGLICIWAYRRHKRIQIEKLQQAQLVGFQSD